MTPPTTQSTPLKADEDVIIVRLHPDSTLAKLADKDLTANAQLMKEEKTHLLARLIQQTLGPAFTVRAA